jgi:hypothetical protein
MGRVLRETLDLGKPHRLLRNAVPASRYDSLLSPMFPLKEPSGVR